jgi:serine/threonine protein kinase
MKGFSHGNILKLLEVYEQTGDIILVFEDMETDIENLISQRENLLTREDLYVLVSSVLLVLKYSHAKGSFRWKLNPASIFVKQDQANCKLDVKVGYSSPSVA